MKKQLFSAVAAVAFGSVVAQTPSPSWSITQNASFTVTSAGTRYLDAVDANVVWLAGYDGNNASRNYNWYSRTINGGTSYNSGNIFPDTNTYVLANMEGIDANTCWVSAFTKSLQAQGAIYRTINGGANWINMTAPGMFTNTAAFADVVSFLTPNNGIVLGDPVNSEFELWTTTNGGTSWTPVPGANIPNPIAAEFGIVDLYDKVGPNNMWFGTNKGRIYYTTNSGTSWNVSVVAPAATSTITEIAFASVTNGICYVSNGGANLMLFNTTDGGVTWNQVNTTDPDLGRNDLAGIPGTNNFASVDNGNTVISYSTDNGLTWTNWGGIGVPYLKVDFVDVNTAWAGSFSSSTNTAVGGIWKYAGVTSNFNVPTNVCRTAATVTVSPVNLSTGVSLTFSWSAAPSVVISSPTATTPVLTFSANGVYVVTLTTTNNLGVVATGTQAINVLTCTTPTANFNIPTTVCNNVAFLLTNASSGVPSPTFVITTSAASGVTVNPATGPSTVSIRFATPGIYTITSTANNIYGQGVTSKTINVQNCAPIAAFNFTPTFLCLDSTFISGVVLANNTTTGNGVSYTWNSTPSAFSFTNSGISRKYRYTQPGTYVVTLVASNPSGTSTATGTLLVTQCFTGLNEGVNLASILNVYPNPAHDQLNIVLPSNSNVYKIKMINVVGAIVYEETTVKNSKETVSISLANKPKGVYFLSVESGTEKAVKKIIVE